MDDLLLICSCGGETRLWNRSFGDVVQCIHCGAHLEVAEDNTRRLESDEKEDTPFSEGEVSSEDAPEGPAAADKGLQPLVPPGMTPEEQRAASEVALFLADEADEASAGAASADAASEEQPRPQIPPTRSGPGPSTRKPGQTWFPSSTWEPGGRKPGSQVERKSGSQVELGNQVAPVVVPKAQLDSCSRCKRPFRGDWDRHDTDYGTFCNVCFNLAQDMETHAATAPPSPPPGTIQLEMARQTSWTPYEDPKSMASALDDERRKRYIGMAILAVLAIITIAAVLLWSPEQTAVERPAAPDVSPDTARKLNVLVMLVQLFMMIAKNAVPIYLTLVLAQKLPNDTFLKNLLAVLLVSVAVCAIGMFPFIGGIAGIVFVYWMYNLSFGEVVTFIVFRILASILVSLLGLAILGTVSWSLF